MPPLARRLGRIAAVWLGYALVAAVIGAPLAAERAVESVRFDDRLGTLPVQVSLAHNGASTLDTGILGRLYYDRTGVAGFGAVIRATGPPEAGGTLASYASPKFVRTNAQFVNDPDTVAQAYSSKFRDELWSGFWRTELLVALIGGSVLTLAFRARAPMPSAWTGRWRRAGFSGALVVLAVGGTTMLAIQQFEDWEGSTAIEASYPMPGLEELSFSSPEALEVARQIQPFIEKNTDRIRQRGRQYEVAAVASMKVELPLHVDDLTPREGETIVLGEADPQGSEVATAARTSLYPLLFDALGEDSFAMRTISGDITSNGTVAENGFVADEAVASGDLPVVVVKGDHDTATTVEQFGAHGIINPEFDVDEVGGLDVVAGNDPAFKALFGGLVINESGTTETELGENLRAEVDGDDGRRDPLVVLFHQPRSAAGYIGVSAFSDLDPALGRETTPYDDGIPDLPPGIINIGHLHDVSPPRVIWNTDTEDVTWTVVNQLGTSGGVEESPTFNRFSTPFSVPLKDVSIQLQYVDEETGLQTGYADIAVSTDGAVSIGDRVDLGLPLEEPPGEERPGPGPQSPTARVD